MPPMPAKAPETPAAEITSEETAPEVAAHEQAIQDRNALREAQSSKARSIKLTKLARKDPAIRALIEENKQLHAELVALRTPKS